MVDGRFIEVACELVGEKSPDQIRYEIRKKELDKLIAEHIQEDMNASHEKVIDAIFEDSNYTNNDITFCTNGNPRLIIDQSGAIEFHE